jgi:hypothetical protein
MHTIYQQPMQNPNQANMGFTEEQLMPTCPVNKIHAAWSYSLSRGGGAKVSSLTGALIASETDLQGPVRSLAGSVNCTLREGRDKTIELLVTDGSHRSDGRRPKTDTGSASNYA